MNIFNWKNTFIRDSEFHVSSRSRSRGMQWKWPKTNICLFLQTLFSYEVSLGGVEIDYPPFSSPIALSTNCTGFYEAV